MGDTFYLDGEDARNYGIRLQRPVSISAAVPAVKKVKVPGRNGDLLLPSGAYENRSGRADCFALAPDVQDTVTRAAAFLLSSPGYRRLECSNDPQHFWLARIVNGVEVNDRMQTLNPFKVKLDLKPQRFAVEGEQPIELTQDGSVMNLHGMPALPLIKVYGNAPGTLVVNDSQVEIKSLDGVVFLDSETSNAYNGLMNENKNVNAPTFPVLAIGENTVKFTGGIQKVEIIPRWCDL